MMIEYNDKGKYFTEVISKDLVLTHIQTQTYTIRGYIHVRKDERLSDEVNKDTTFLAVTDSEVYSLKGAMLFTSNFMVINRAHIVWLMPIDTDQGKPE
jgi:hypothetical protein